MTSSQSANSHRARVARGLSRAPRLRRILFEGDQKKTAMRSMLVRGAFLLVSFMRLWWRSTENPRRSDCLEHQAGWLAITTHGVSFVSIALRIMSSFLMQAVNANFFASPPDRIAGGTGKCGRILPIPILRR